MGLPRRSLGRGEAKTEQRNGGRHVDIFGWVHFAAGGLLCIAALALWRQDRRIEGELAILRGQAGFLIGRERAHTHAIDGQGRILDGLNRRQCEEHRELAIERIRLDRLDAERGRAANRYPTPRAEAN